MQKKCIRYLRFSSQGQSNSSIERQDLLTAQWASHAGVEIIDTFTDEGYSARTFDRPDLKELFAFIRKNQRNIDYLVVSELTRFSREAGDAINMVKEVQSRYGIRIVSASRGAIYDALDHNSFFMMGLEFLMGNSENLKRISDINGGIYAAKAKEGRFIGGKIPFGYTIEGSGKTRTLVVNQEQAPAVRYIFDAFLNNVPIYLIDKEARQRGFLPKGKVIIQHTLSNPVYAGYQYVKAYKDLPGGLFPARHEAIISLAIWNRVQEKMTKPEKPSITVSDEIPLRGVLRCHCGRHLTGAPSRGHRGGYYYYYKCNTNGHLNLSAKKAHGQLQEILAYMSLPDRMFKAIRERSEELLEERLQHNKTALQRAKRELATADADIQSLEEKWLRNQTSFEMYDRWSRELSTKRIQLRGQVEKLSQDGQQTAMLLQHELVKLSDLPYLYEKMQTVNKQEFLRMGFDNTLSYQDGTYRTQYIMPIFRHNELILKEKRLLFVDAFGRNLGVALKGGSSRARTVDPQIMSVLQCFIPFI